MNRCIYALLDIDGVVGRSPWQHCANWLDHSKLTQWLAEQSNQGWQFVITFVTDRPCGNLELLCYLYHATETSQLGESGGAAFDPMRKWQWPNPQFDDFRQSVRADMLETLKLTVAGDGQLYQQESGGRLVTIGIVPADQSEAKTIYQQVLTALEPKPYFGQLRYETGKVLVFYPRQLNKQTALQWHEQLFFQKYGQPYPWHQAIFVADSWRDIVAAQFAHQKGAQVAAVGNADSRYQLVIKQCGGIVANGEYEAGLQEILKTFIHQL